MRNRLSTFVLTCLLSSGCKSITDCDVAGWAPCNITRIDCQENVLAAVQCDRGSELDAMPPIRSITRSELRSELMAAAATSEPDDEWDDGLTLLGLLGSESSSRATVDATVALTDAWYSAETGVITILGGDGPQATLSLAHELVHAIQDDRYDLGVFVSEATSTDALDARRSIAEGDAYFFTARFLVRQLRHRPDEVDWDAYYDDLRQTTLETVASAEDPYATARVVLPYYLGARRVHDAWVASGEHLFDARSPEFVDAFYEMPPASIVGLMDPSVTTTEDLGCAPPAPPGGFRTVRNGALGTIGLFAFLAAHGTADEAWSLARQWRTDGMSVAIAGSSVVVVWRIRTSGDPSELANGTAVRAWVAAEPDGRLVATSDRDVILVASNQSSVAESWSAAVAACP